VNILKRIAAGIVAVVSFGSSLQGCNRHILDGPGMVNDLTWTEFTLSRSDSYAQYNFWITVVRTDNAFLLTGEVWNEEGYLVHLEDGKALSADDILYLRSLHLGDLADWTPSDSEDDMIILDAPSISLELVCPDGTRQHKNIGDELSFEIYRRFLPYF
jgi:hypothetical protein